MDTTYIDYFLSEEYELMTAYIRELQVRLVLGDRDE